MIKRVLRKLSSNKPAKRVGVENQNGFELFNYHNSKGEFDYETYRKTQIEGNKKKLDRVWVKEENIVFLSNYLKDKLDQPDFGICHGTRRGYEQKWFREQLGIEVIGTEISETAIQFPNTIQWDFHNVKEEWKESVDFIYSNSFDHSYDPKLCLNAWMSCIKSGGVCILEHTSLHERATALDPFGASISLMPYLILMWAEGNYYVREIVAAPNKPAPTSYLNYIIIEKA